MSTTPEPMTEERLTEIAAIYARSVGGQLFKFDIQVEGGEKAERSLRDICALSKDSGELLAEVRRLKAVQRAAADQIDQQAAHLKTAQDLLLERSRQAEELFAEVERLKAELGAAHGLMARGEGRIKEIVDEKLLRERDKAFVMNERLMEGLAHIHDYAGMSHGADWTRYYELCERTIGAVGQAEVDLFKARRAVLDAAIAYHQVEVNQSDVEGGAEFCEYLWKLIEKLKQLEAGR